jgi:hypothetical protein
MRTYLWLGALVWSVAVSLFLIFGPAYAVESSIVGPQASGILRSSSGALAVNGPRILLVLGIPILLTGLPLLLRGRMRTPGAMIAIALLVVFCVMSSASVGLLYLPGVFLLILAFASRAAPVLTEAKTD